ncbi:hypothetical protein GF385_03200 [Candidatus Dependentiae bacterium]|nr:hypothetical protein [Candidatus Dependentiae bacterium]
MKKIILNFLFIFGLLLTSFVFTQKIEIYRKDIPRKCLIKKVYECEFEYIEKEDIHTFFFYDWLDLEYDSFSINKIEKEFYTKEFEIGDYRKVCFYIKKIIIS